MNTVIERVARAICRRWLMKAGLEMAFDGDASPIQLAAATLSAVDQHWREFIPEAEDAIAAIREPDSAMMQAGYVEDGCPSNGWLTDDGWRAMIDALLAGGTKAESAKP